MLCAICFKHLPHAPPSPSVCSPPLSRLRVHSDCLRDSFVFTAPPTSASKIATLSTTLGIDSIHPATRWLSVGSRLSALGLTDVPASKYKWEDLQEAGREMGTADREKMPGLLRKRDFDDLVSNKERGFNLDLFDLVQANYDLTHPALENVRKVGVSQPKTQCLEINQNEVDHRMEGIRVWLEKVTKNCNYDALPDQMMNYIKKPSDGEIFRKILRDQGQVPEAVEKDDFIQHFYFESKNLLEKCTRCQNKNLKIPKLLIETQNESHYLRWSSNPVDIKILTKSSKKESKRKCRMIRYVCIRCIQEKKLNNFIKKNSFNIFKLEHERLFRPVGHLDYLRRGMQKFKIVCPPTRINEIFLSKLNFHECVKEETVRTVIKKKSLNGKEAHVRKDTQVRKESHPKETLKKIKPTPTETITDNKKILSKILDDFTLSEQKKPILPAKLPTLIREESAGTKDFAIHLPDQSSGGKSNQEFSVPNKNITQSTNQGQLAHHAQISEISPISNFLVQPRDKKKIILNLQASTGDKHGKVKIAMEKQLKKWKNLFSNKQEIEEKLTIYKASLTLENIKAITQLNTSGREKVKKKGNKNSGSNPKKTQANRTKLAKIKGQQGITQHLKVPDLKRESFESQLREERKISHLIYNKSTKKLDIRLIQQRHGKILSDSKFKSETENKHSKPPLLKENGHFNWDYLEDEYFDQKNYNQRVLGKLDKKLMKKLYSEFILLNENQLKEKTVKNFLADYLIRRQAQNVGQSFKDSSLQNSMAISGNTFNGLSSMNESVCGPQQSQRKLAKHLEKFEETYMKKFKKLIYEKVRQNNNLLQKRILYPDASVATLNRNFPNRGEKIGNLPVNYFEDIIAPTENCFQTLKRNLSNQRIKIVTDMAVRVRRHYQWIDPQVVGNKVVWTGMKNYFQDQELFQVKELGEKDFDIFLQMFFEEKDSQSIMDDSLWRSSCQQLSNNVGFEQVISFLKDEQVMTLQQKRNFVVYTDFYKKMKFLLTYEHYKINKGLIKDSSKLDETDCVLCFTAITCLSNPIIYCSKCERGAHRVCLRLPSVPSEDFFCVTCCEELKKKTKKKEKEQPSAEKGKVLMSNWMSECKVNKWASQRFKGSNQREKGEQLFVDKTLLIMKNKNPAGRTEDINRILSSTLNIKFEGKLYKIMEKWVHLEVPLRVLVPIVYALLKANFKVKMTPGLVLDLVEKKLYVDPKLKENQVFLHSDRKYNLEEWIYNNKNCIIKKMQLNFNPGYPLYSKAEELNWGKRLGTSLPTVNQEEKRELDKQLEHENLVNMKEVYSRGMSHQIKTKLNSQDFDVFRSENMMVVKKFLENDVNLKRCITGDLPWKQKMSKEISNEIRRVVQILRDFQPDMKEMKRNGSLQSDYFKQETVEEDFGEQTEFAKKKAVLGNSKFDFKNSATKNGNKDKDELEEKPVYEKPKNQKSSKINYYQLSKVASTTSKEFVIQDIKMTKLISFKRHITDDIRFNAELLVFKHQQTKMVTVRLSEVLKQEISMLVHNYELNYPSNSKDESDSTDRFEIKEEPVSQILKVKMKNKPLNSAPCLNNGITGIFKYQKRDCCYYCNKSDLMLIDFESKKVHLICLIISGNLLDFFEKPECKLSTFIMFVKIVKYNLFNFLLKKDWKVLLNKMRLKFDSVMSKEQQIELEMKKILMGFKVLREEVIEVGLIIFKKYIVDKSCHLCYEKIDSTKKGCLFRFLINFYPHLIQDIIAQLVSNRQELPFYSSTIQQMLSTIKNIVELGSPYLESFPKTSKFQNSFLKKEFSILRCQHCPDKFFHGICAYFNGNKLLLYSSDSTNKFTNFLKKDPSDFAINSYCTDCSKEEYQKENSARNILQVEFLRRLPVNIDFIKKKLDFESFLEWKKQHQNYFTLE